MLLQGAGPLHIASGSVSRRQIPGRMRVCTREGVGGKWLLSRLPAGVLAKGVSAGWSDLITQDCKMQRKGRAACQGSQQIIFRGKHNCMHTKVYSGVLSPCWLGGTAGEWATNSESGKLTTARSALDKGASAHVRVRGSCAAGTSATHVPLGLRVGNDREEKRQRNSEARMCVCCAGMRASSSRRGRPRGRLSWTAPWCPKARENGVAG